MVENNNFFLELGPRRLLLVSESIFSQNIFLPRTQGPDMKNILLPTIQGPGMKNIFLPTTSICKFSPMDRKNP